MTCHIVFFFVLFQYPVIFSSHLTYGNMFLQDTIHKCFVLTSVKRTPSSFKYVSHCLFYSNEPPDHPSDKTSNPKSFSSSFLNKTSSPNPLTVTSSYHSLYNSCFLHPFFSIPVLTTFTISVFLHKMNTLFFSE